MAEKKKLALIGCGGIGGYHLEHLIQFKEEGIVDLVGFCDLIEERAKNYAEKAGCDKYYTDFAVMCDEVKPDMCFICIPPYCHGAVEKGLIARGIHFFVEKPVALDMELAKEIRDLAAENNIITAVGFQCRASNLVAPQKKFMEENEIVFVSCNRMGGLPGTPWWHIKELSGGQIVEQTIHNFDIVRYLVGEPEEVFTYGQRGNVKNYKGTPADYDTDDLTTSVVRFKNGVLASLNTGCYITSGEGFDSNFTFSAKDKRCELRILSRLDIYGEKAEKKAEAEKAGFVIANDGGIAASSGDFIRYRSSGDAGMTNDRAFVNAVITGDKSGIYAPYEDAVKTLAFVLACNKSMETGMPVKVENMLK